VDDEGRQVRRSEGGEFLARGPYVTVGYWVGPDRSEATTRDGWYHGFGDDADALGWTTLLASSRFGVPPPRLTAPPGLVGGGFFRQIFVFRFGYNLLISYCDKLRCFLANELILNE
jgi:hypothetical protein